MIHHILFCLDEIDSEIAPHQGNDLPDALRGEISAQVAKLRATLEAARADDLTYIRGIDPAMRTLLAAKGITRFATIANWRRADLAALAGDGLSIARISQECWIEQAAILATGAKTDFAKRIDRGELFCLVPRIAEVVESAERVAPDLAAVAAVPGPAVETAKIIPMTQPAADRRPRLRRTIAASLAILAVAAAVINSGAPSALAALGNW